MTTASLVVRLTLPVALATLAAAQTQFAVVDPNAGLSHTVAYGTTFPHGFGHPYLHPFVMTLMQRNIGQGAALGDIDGDGDHDIYLLAQLGFPNVLLRNDSTPGNWSFTDISAGSGLDVDALSRTAYFCDLDNDGWQDLVLLNDNRTGDTYPASQVFRNVGGTFTDVTAGSGFDPVGYLKGGVCLGDYNKDGLVDIYTAIWPMHIIGGPAPFEGHARLYRNLGGFRFADVTASANLPALGRDCFSCVFADFDNDNDVDLYIAIDHTADAYFRNNNNGTFGDFTLPVGATHTGNDMGLAVADFDRDGDLDIFSTNITDAGGFFGTTQYNTLLINQRTETGTFSLIDNAVAAGVADTGWAWGTEFFDADNDGDLDLYAVNGFDEWIEINAGPGYPLLDTPAVLFTQDPNGTLVRTTGSGADIAGDARAAIAHDLNGDGRSDLLVTRIDQPGVLLENITANAGHWLTIDPVGGGAISADALNARVFVTIGGVEQMQEIIAGGSYLSGRPHEAHFGLGNATAADEVRIRWPGGSETNLGSLDGDRTLRVHLLPGDADLNGTIDLRDVAIMQRCGTTEPWTRCSAFDFDLDGDVDALDYAAFLNGF